MSPRTADASKPTPSASPALVTALALLSAMLGGCFDGLDLRLPPDASTDGTEPPVYDTPAALIAAHAGALTDQDYATYEQLLAADFEFFPVSEDLVDLPWMQGDSWSRADELQMIAHMFDDTYQPTDPAASTVDTIDATFTITSVQTLPHEARLVMTTAIFTVLFGNGNGARADVRLEFTLVPSGEGYLRIRSIRELPLYRAVDPQSWGKIKNLYL